MSEAVPLVCICGPSAAGKTTFAAHLATQLRARGHQPLLISCDDYYRSGWSPNSRYGFDTVDAIDADRLRRLVDESGLFVEEAHNLVANVKRGSEVRKAVKK